MSRNKNQFSLYETKNSSSTSAIQQFDEDESKIEIPINNIQSKALRTTAHKSNLGIILL
jgi:hypothetical protein